MNVVDLWCEEPTNVEEVIIEEKAPAKKTGTDTSCLYVVTAGINNITGRQLFLSTFEDCDEWSISVVPSVLRKHRACRLMEIAQKYIDENPQRYRHKPPKLALESVDTPEIHDIVRCIIR